MNTYAVYVIDDAGWRECPDYHGVFFGDEEPYIHPVRGGIEPAGHLLVKGYYAALQKCDQFNRSGDWQSHEDGEVRHPLYGIKKLVWEPK